MGEYRIFVEKINSKIKTRIEKVEETEDSRIHGKQYCDEALSVEEAISKEVKKVERTYSMEILSLKKEVRRVEDNAAESRRDYEEEI